MLRNESVGRSYCCFQALIAVCRDNSRVHSTRPAVPEWLCDIALFAQWTQSSSH